MIWAKPGNIPCCTKYHRNAQKARRASPAGSRGGDAPPAGRCQAGGRGVSESERGDGAVDCVSAAVLGEAQQAGVGRDGRDVEFGGLDRRP